MDVLNLLGTIIIKIKGRKRGERERKKETRKDLLTNYIILLIFVSKRLVLTKSFLS